MSIRLIAPISSPVSRRVIAQVIPFPEAKVPGREAIHASAAPSG